MSSILSLLTRKFHAKAEKYNELWMSSDKVIMECIDDIISFVCHFYFGHELLRPTVTLPGIFFSQSAKKFIEPVSGTKIPSARNKFNDCMCPNEISYLLGFPLLRCHAFTS